MARENASAARENYNAAREYVATGRKNGAAARKDGVVAREADVAARKFMVATRKDGVVAREFTVAASERQALESAIDVLRRAEHPLDVSDRLQKFRQYMASLDPAADPQLAIERGLYVPRAGRTLIDEVAGRLELHPASTHLVVGGIGSGKTTQLLMAKQRLDKLADTHAVYIDVSSAHDIADLKPRVLLVLAGLRLIKLLNVPTGDELSAVVNKFQRVANGYTYFRSHFEFADDSSEPGEYIKTPGILKPPQLESLSAGSLNFVDTLRLLQKHIAAQLVPNIVFLFDSLDRLVDADGFEQVVMEDVRVLRSLGFGVVLVGPLKLLYGAYRPIVQQFNSLHQVQWSNPDDADGRTFLLNVLDARDRLGLLTLGGAAGLVELSGGVLRDLIGLARNAGEEAYLSGDPQITAVHSDAAGEAFGRTLLLGLDPDDLAKLQSVRKNATFVPVSDKDLALLMTGRVLEYRGSKPRYAVHPTIAPLLAQLAGETS